MNTVCLVGKLVQDPRPRQTPRGTPVCGLRLAFTQRETNEPGYVDVVCFGRLAETCSIFLRKGRQVGITGRLTYDEWMPPGASLPHRRLSIVVASVDWLGRPENPGEPVSEEGDDVPIEERPLSALVPVRRHPRPRG